MWSRAAQFDSLQAAGLALRRLEALFFSQESLIGYRIVLPGSVLQRSDNVILVAAICPGVMPDTMYEIDRIHEAMWENGGILIELPDTIIDRMRLDVADRLATMLVEGPPPAPNLMFLSTMDHLVGLDMQREEPLVVTSHAKCRDCGQVRHKIARLNLCQECWEKIKPSVRREWREIKDRRKLRESVDDHLAEQKRQREAQDQMVALRQARNNARRNGPDMPELTDQEAAKLEIARMRAAGEVPVLGTPERANYMRLHVIANGGQRRQPDELDRVIARLYQETRIQVKDILTACGVDNNRLRRVQHKLSVPNRDDIPGWYELPKIMDPGEKLLLVDMVPMIANGAGTLRPVFTDAETEPEFEPEYDASQEDAEEEPEEEPAPESEPEPEPVLAAHEPVEATTNGTERRHRRQWSWETKAEIAGWYADPSIPVREIKQAYGASNGIIDRARREFGVPLRITDGAHLRRNQRTGPSNAGRFEVIDGRRQWIQGDVAQLHLGQAETEVAMQDVIEEVVMPSVIREIETAREVSRALDIIDVPAPRHGWLVQVVVTRTRLLPEQSFDEAVAAVRAEFGQDADIRSISWQ